VCITLSTGHLKVEEACQLSQVYLAKVRKYEYRVANVEEKKRSVAKSCGMLIECKTNCLTANWESSNSFPVCHKKYKSSLIHKAH